MWLIRVVHDVWVGRHVRRGYRLIGAGGVLHRLPPVCVRRCMHVSGCVWHVMCLMMHVLLMECGLMWLLL